MGFWHGHSHSHSWSLLYVPARWMERLQETHRFYHSTLWIPEKDIRVKINRDVEKAMVCLPRKIVDKCWIFPLGTGSFPPKTPQWTTAWKRFHESRAVHGVTLSTTNSFLLRRRGTWKELKAWLQIKTPWFPVDLPSAHLTSISMGLFHGYVSHNQRLPIKIAHKNVNGLVHGTAWP